ncbi:MAG: transmembrane transport protein [Acidobacteriota bacterium]
MSDETIAQSPLSPATPAVDAAAIRRLAHAELSTRSRFATVGLLLLATGVVVTVGSLWLTEPDLPFRTSLAFAVMCAIGSAWAVFSVWILTQRRVLYARHRIGAARIAVVASGLFVAGAVTYGLTQQVLGALLAGALGGVLLALAWALLRRAQAQVKDLEALRRRLSTEDNAAELAA